MQIYNLSASFTRPVDTTAYASGDLVANSVTAGSVVPLSFASQTSNVGGPLTIRRVRLSKSSTTATLSAFRVHFYSASPVPTNGDNGAWLTTQAANYLGFIDMPTLLLAFGDGCAHVGAVGAEGTINVRGTTLYALLEARAAYVPASAEIFTLGVELIEGGY